MDQQLNSNARVRLARRDDVPAIVALLADDILGARREQATEPLPSGYWDAFDAIAKQPGDELFVADLDGEVIGCLQLTTDKTRVDAHRFYERLGFEATHVGMKRGFDP